jgi:hypothetical protein
MYIVIATVLGREKSVVVQQNECLECGSWHINLEKFKKNRPFILTHEQMKFAVNKLKDICGIEITVYQVKMEKTTII